MGLAPREGLPGLCVHAVLLDFPHKTRAETQKRLQSDLPASRPAAASLPHTHSGTIRPFEQLAWQLVTTLQLRTLPKCEVVNHARRKPRTKGLYYEKPIRSRNDRNP
ncbi:hypothetical protein L226DRAFT_567288 [Lentinus tigrinus ALCF2SS1-7]|uniref:Uncharacterized protein n=1 Tax=Lentinus tigrinus ALCF2SS1-6 TaxID=1328759 RepID=A0A5C2SQT7_9APHY|nr:hypothetical protein L227DRAFT_606983 [Lentinus tigrinus ALCF2SS1-6]RPD79102.1 hypothetical protein L226DRAFT_567288 [Lentinus tigrinus ALCF2SS1-7]